MFIFVYGTLRKGGPLHSLLTGLTFVGEFKTKPIYTLYDMGCPCLALGGATAVVGEIYSTDDLSQLSRFHFMELGAGYSFETVQIDGFDKPVFAYLQNPKEWKLGVIKSGDYLKHRAEELAKAGPVLPSTSGSGSE